MRINAIPSITDISVTRVTSDDSEPLVIVAPGTVAASAQETARAQVNAAQVNFSIYGGNSMAPTRDGIYSIGAVAVKTSGISALNRTESGSGWGFWAIAATVFSLVMGNAPVASAHWGFDNDRIKKNLPLEVPKKCSEDFSAQIHAKTIKSGRYVSFASADFAPYIGDDVSIDSAVLTLVIRGKEKELKNLNLSCNGLRMTGSHGRQSLDLIRDYFGRLEHHFPHKAWWWSWYWRYYLKYSFWWYKDSLVISVDLTDYLVNNQQHFREYFEKILKNRGSIEFAVGGIFSVVDASLKIEGSRKVVCVKPTPIPTVAPTASPAPTPVPTPIPTPVPVAPHTQITNILPNAALTAQTAISFAFSSDQAGVSFECSLDGAAAALCSSPKSYSGLSNGSHSFKVVARSASGLVDPVGASHQWVVDSIAPDVVLGSIIPSESVTKSSTIQLSFSSNEGQSFQCSLDGGSYSACVSPVSFSGLSEGGHEIDIIAVDNAGNTSLAPARYQWTIDQTKPIANVVQAIPAAQFTASDSLSLSFSANESAQFECSLDGASFAACVSPHVFSGLSDGAHSVAVRAVDVAGNIGQPVNYLWNIDSVAPVLNLGNVVPAVGVANATSVSVEFSANEPSRFECSVDNAALSVCVSPLQTAVQGEGSHSVSVVAIDMAGNRSAIRTLNWTMDYSAPQISFGAMTPSASSNIAVDSLVVEVNATEPVTYSSQLDGVDLAQFGSPIRLSNLTEGTHTLVLNAIDGAGNAANTIEHTFVVDVTAPLLTIDSSEVSGQSNITSNAFTFSSNENVSFECNLNGSGYSQCVSPFSVSGLIEGTHLFQVRAIDLAGNVSAVASKSWVVDQTAPSVNILGANPGGSIIKGSSIQISFMSSDASASYSCSLDGIAFSSCSSPVTYNALSEAVHSLQVRALDVAQNMSVPAAYSFTVDNVAPVVSLGSSVAATTTADAVVFNFSASETASFKCSLDGAAMSACLSPSSYSGLAAGAHSFSVVATDVVGNSSVSASFNWVVESAIVTTITAVTPTGSVITQADITFEFGASIAGSSFQCSLDGGAYSACVSPTTYSNLTNGQHSFVVRATSPSGQVDPVGASYSWSVDATYPAITSFTSSVTGSSFTVNWTTNKPTTTGFFWGAGGATGNEIAEDSVYTTAHSITISGVASNTVYSFKMAGHDQTGRYMLSGRNAVRTSN